LSKNTKEGLEMDLSAEQYRIIVEYTPNLIWRSGTDGLCDYFNPRWLEFTGRTMEQELGNGWAEGVHPDDFERCLSIYMESFAKRESFVMQYRLLRHDGEWRWLTDSGAPYYDENGEFAGFIGSCMDITEQVNGELWKEMAQKDGLTCIYNRQYFERLAREAFAKAKENKSNLCVVMIDINKFKFMNDYYGHIFGDEVLKAFARFLEENIREWDILGRYGGDEFVIKLPHTTYAEADKLIKNISEILKNPLHLNNGEVIDISFCYGIGELTAEDNWESLIARADKEMYKMKEEFRKANNYQR